MLIKEIELIFTDESTLSISADHIEESCWTVIGEVAHKIWGARNLFSHKNTSFKEDYQTFVTCAIALEALICIGITYSDDTKISLTNAKSLVIKNEKSRIGLLQINELIMGDLYGKDAIQHTNNNASTI